MIKQLIFYVGFTTALSSSCPAVALPTVITEAFDQQAQSRSPYPDISKEECNSLTLYHLTLAPGFTILASKGTTSDSTTCERIISWARDPFAPYPVLWAIEWTFEILRSLYKKYRAPHVRPI